MSTCPEFDLHSVYLDNELPEPYRTRFEAHIAGCATCRERLARMKAMQAALRADADSIHLPEKELEAGFERLQVRLNYHNIVNRNSTFTYIVRRIAPAVAAALVLALILPVRLLKNSSSDIPQSLSEAQFAPFVATVQQPTSATVAKPVIYNGVSPQQNAVAVNLQNHKMATIDIFRPDFSDDVIHITIDLGDVSGLYSNGSTAHEMPVLFSLEGL